MLRVHQSLIISKIPISHGANSQRRSEPLRSLLNRKGLKFNATKLNRMALRLNGNASTRESSFAPIGINQLARVRIRGIKHWVSQGEDGHPFHHTLEGFMPPHLNLDLNPLVTMVSF